MLRSIKTLLPYCTRLCLYLNNYDDTILDELKKNPYYNKIIPLLAGTDPVTGKSRKFPDKRSHGKQHWLGVYDGYYFTCDDDCLYPANYIPEMIKALLRYDNKVIVSCSGGVRRRDATNSAAWFLGINRVNSHDTPVNFFGGASTAMHPRTIGATSELSDFVVEGSKNYIENCVSDDTCIAVWANVNSVPVVLVARKANWLTFDISADADYSLCNVWGRVALVTKQIEAQFKLHGKPVQWRLHEPMLSIHANKKDIRAMKCGEHVTIAMASYPARRRGMLGVVRTLLPQCDKMCLYLNNYDDAVIDEINAIDKDGKTEIILSGVCHETGEVRHHRDLRNNGKLYFLTKTKIKEYYLTVDDDIQYPPDYVATMVAHCAAFNNRVIVTAHGINYCKDNAHRIVSVKGLSVIKQCYCIGDEHLKYTAVHEGGNAVMAMHPKTLFSNAIRFSIPDIYTMDIMDGDDTTIAVAAQNASVPIIRVPTEFNWVRNDAVLSGTTALYANSPAQKHHAKQRLNHGMWRNAIMTYPTLRQDCVILGSYLTGINDPQRSTQWKTDVNAVAPYLESIRSRGIRAVLLHNCFHDGHCATHPQSLYDARQWLSESKYPDNPYYNKFWLPLCWLKQNVGLRYAFVTDSTDVELVRSPFGMDCEKDVLKSGRLYVGDEHRPVGIPWMLKPGNAVGFVGDFIKNNRNKLINSGVMGGNYELLVEFLEDIIATYDDVYLECGKIPDFDMGVFNYVCYSEKWWPYIEYGRHVTSVFKAYDKNTNAWFRHK